MEAPPKPLSVDIHTAVKEGDIVKVLEFLEEGGDVNVRCRHRTIPLHRAAAYNHLDIADLLLTKGADIEVGGAGWGGANPAVLGLQGGARGDGDPSAVEGGAHERPGQERANPAPRSRATREGGDLRAATQERRQEGHHGRGRERARRRLGTQRSGERPQSNT